MNVLTDEELAAIRQRCEAAPPGPWEWTGERKYLWGNEHPSDLRTLVLVGKLQRKADLLDTAATFIAAARTDVPKLLAEVDRLRAELATARGDYEAAMGFIAELESK